jgi:hypothetical protein
MAIILKANKVNLFVSSVLFVFWYYSPNFLDTPRKYCLLLRKTALALAACVKSSSYPGEVHGENIKALSQT